MPTSQPAIQINDYVLTVGDDYAENLPHLARAATVSVWQVPPAYRASGFYVGVYPQGQPEDLPACDYRDAVFVADLPLPAHPDAIAAELRAVEIEAAKAALRDIDIASIRSLREYVASREGAPQFIRDHEDRARAARGKIVTA